jgi:hypothetical protein
LLFGFLPCSLPFSLYHKTESMQLCKLPWCVTALFIHSNRGSLPNQRKRNWGSPLRHVVCGQGSGAHHLCPHIVCAERKTAKLRIVQLIHRGGTGDLLVLIYSLDSIIRNSIFQSLASPKLNAKCTYVASYTIMYEATYIVASFQPLCMWYRLVHLNP